MRRATLLFSAVLTGCASAPVELPDHDGPLSFRVELLDDVGGHSAEEPLPFSADGRELDLRITALGYDHEPMEWDGPIQIKVTPGQLDASDNQVQMSGGVVETTVEVSLAYDQVRIWASDEGDGETTGSFATGVSDRLWFARPTIAESQRPLVSDGTSPVNHRYVSFRAWGDEFGPRNLVVHSVTNDGFYVTDNDDAPGTFNSLFVFTFSRPDGVEVGTRLAQLDGIVSEFLGYTELSFPSWIVDSTGHEPAEPQVLDASVVCDNEAMEAWEGSLVRLENLTADFGGIGDCNDYEEYGQWPAELEGSCDGGSARINIVNINTVPDFSFNCDDPQSLQNIHLDYLVGLLRHNTAANPHWILDVRSCLDFPPEDRPTNCGTAAEPRLSGPKKAPELYYRDIPSCEGDKTPIGSKYPPAL